MFCHAVIYMIQLMIFYDSCTALNSTPATYLLPTDFIIADKTFTTDSKFGQDPPLLENERSHGYDKLRQRMKKKMTMKNKKAKKQKRKWTPYPNGFPTWRWPNNTIPYELILNEGVGNVTKMKLAYSMRSIESSSCIRFVPNKAYNGETRSLRIIIHSLFARCDASHGYLPLGQNQIILNQAECCEVRSMLHFLMHVLGFNHEHERIDRNNWLTFIDDESLYPKGFYDVDNFLLTPYDYRSVTQYETTSPAGSIADKNFVKKGSNDSIVPRPTLSYYDQMKINLLYKCGMDKKECKDKNNPMSEEAALEPASYCPCQNTTCRDYITYKQDYDLCCTKGLGVDPKNKTFLRLAPNCTDVRWAFDNCRKTCGFCDYKRTVWKWLDPDITKTPPPCEDEMGHCLLWANDKTTNWCTGRDNITSWFMKVYCRKSCNLCNISLSLTKCNKFNDPYCDNNTNERTQTEINTRPYLLPVDFLNAQMHTPNITQDKCFPDDSKFIPENYIRGHLNAKNLSTYVYNRTCKPWPDGKIPYKLILDYHNRSREYIAWAMNTFHLYSCVRFIPAESYNGSGKILYIDGLRYPDEDWLRCFADCGYEAKENTLLLRLDEPDCFRNQIMLHEMMHLIGFGHEHQRMDRDRFVTLLPGYDRDYNYARGYDDVGHTAFWPYDYDSVTHYPSRKSIKNGEWIMRRKDNNEIIGLNQKLSFWDKAKINLLYKCGMSDPACQDKAPNLTWYDVPHMKQSHKAQLQTCQIDGLGKSPWPPYQFRAMYEAKCSDVTWALDNCARTCGVCHTTPISDFDAMKNLTSPPPPKEDIEKKKLLLKKTKKEKKLKNRAKHATTPCRDKHSHCKVWARDKKENWCNRKEKDLKKYMKEQCAKSCNFC